MDVDALVVDTCVRLHPTVFPKNSLNRKDCCLYDTASCNMTNKHQRSEGYPPPPCTADHRTYCNEAAGSSKPFVSVSSKTREVGHPCNSATLLPHRQSPMIYMAITQQTGRLFIANFGHSFKFNTTCSVEVQPPHVGRLVEVYFCTSLCRGRNPHSLAKLPVFHTDFMLSSQATPVANDYCLLRGLCACCPSAPPVSAL